MSKHNHSIFTLLLFAIACVLMCSCDPGFQTECYIRNNSSYSVTISNYTMDGYECELGHIDPITIPSGNTVQLGEIGGLGVSWEGNGCAAFLKKCPEGCEIRFEDGKSLFFRPLEYYEIKNDSLFETHSPYSTSSHDFEMLEERIASTHGKTTYVITDDDYQRAK